MPHDNDNTSPEDHISDFEIDRVLSLAGATFLSAMKAAQEDNICPACVVAALHDLLTQARNQLPHLDPDDKFSIEKVLIHPVEGNA